MAISNDRRHLAVGERTKNGCQIAILNSETLERVCSFPLNVEDLITCCTFSKCGNVRTWCFNDLYPYWCALYKADSVCYSNWKRKSPFRVYLEEQETVMATNHWVSSMQRCISNPWWYGLRGVVTKISFDPKNYNIFVTMTTEELQLWRYSSSTLKKYHINELRDLCHNYKVCPYQ